MQRVSDAGLRSHFLGWQCRIRQTAARDHGGQPMAGMRPRVSSRNGEVLIAAMTVLLLPAEPEASTAFFRFQSQRTNDTSQAREAGVAYLAGDFYQQPELFSDEPTAVFDHRSEATQKLIAARTVLLDFEQYSQSFRMFCSVRQLPLQNAAREASLWQSRLFNPNVANNALVLGFKPDWKNAAADPMPQISIDGLPYSCIGN